MLDIKRSVCKTCQAESNNKSTEMLSFEEARHHGENFPSHHIFFRADGAEKEEFREGNDVFHEGVWMELPGHDR